VTHFLKGIIIGFSIAAPVGPVGLLCLRRALTDGRLVGFISGLGAATADAIYGAIAAFGLSAIIAALNHYHQAIQLFGGVFLLYMGTHTYRAQPPPVAALRRPEHAPSRTAAYLSTLALTLANPITLLALTGILAAVGFASNEDTFYQSGMLITGVFVGSCAWWSIVSSTAGWLGRKLSTQTLRRINHVSGGAILAFGIWQLALLALRYFEKI
jgi:threonine/homoserine/homoserine lactone efflux protein